MLMELFSVISAGAGYSTPFINHAGSIKISWCQLHQHNPKVADAAFGQTQQLAHAAGIIIGTVLLLVVGWIQWDDYVDGAEAVG